MKMTPEENFHRQVWEVLQGIQEEILVTVEGNPVKYRIPSVVGVGIIPPDRRVKIIYKLEEMRAFKILKNESGQRIGRSDLYYLIINKDGFGKVYEFFKIKYFPDKTTTQMADWEDDFCWEGDSYVFGKYGRVTFSSPERKALFKLLTEAKGCWVTVKNIEKEIKKDAKDYIRSTIGQIENQFDLQLRKHVSIPSTQDKNDNLLPKPNQGAYRIRFIVEPQ